MAKDPVVGPVTLYDEQGFPVAVDPNDVVEVEAEVVEAEEVEIEAEPEPEPKSPAVDLPAMRATLEGMKMPELRAFAKDIGVQPARSLAETIDRMMAAFGEGLDPSDLPDDWQAPPLPVPIPSSQFGPAYPPAPPEGVGKSVRIRRIEDAATGKKD